MDSTQLLMFNPPKKTESIKKDSHFSKPKRAYRSQPYDRSSPNTSRSSTGTPPSSPDQNNGENDPCSVGGVNKEQKKQRREEANKRERTRMHTVNSAFDHLRQLVPTYPSNRKLSKIETLRLACSYIQDLTKLVNDNNIQAIHGEDVNLLYRTDHMEGAGSYGSNTTPHYSTTSSNGGNNVAAPTIPGYMNTPLPPATAPSVCTPSSKSDFSMTPPEFTTTSQPQHHQPPVPTAGYYHPHPSTASTLPGNTVPHPGYVNSDPESQSESDIPSPNTAACHYSNMFITPSAPPPPSGIAVRPPPAISRVSSDSIIAMQMANASIGSSSPTYCGSPSAGAPCSPLTRAQHSSSSISHSQITSTLQCNPTPPAGLSSLQPSFTSLHTPLFPQCYSQ